ncbi:hypothetical protein KUCAC02_037850 [Chaenocephalus aceratus]|nr:hypothetical protein KUCAC02_037850 [Chaenocephalus aceratus]
MLVFSLFNYGSDCRAAFLLLQLFTEALRYEIRCSTRSTLTPPISPYTTYFTLHHPNTTLTPPCITLHHPASPAPPCITLHHPHSLLHPNTACSTLTPP